MNILSELAPTQHLCGSWRCERESIGFVPTMGALHAGHLELCRRARDENARLVVSIFLNPAQFGAKEDLSRYPHPFERDCESLRELGCDLVFAPTKEGMYGGADFSHGAWIDVTPFDELWEGVTRPGHLRGVATVVAKLFNLCCPSRAYFGEKDYQQLRVVQSLARDLNFPLEVVPCPTKRERDGLAMSSRNAYLSPEDRQSATVIFRALSQGQQLASNGETDVRRIGAAINAILEAEPSLRTQYLAIVDAETLAPLRELDGRNARVLFAGFIGTTRLIDNVGL